MAKGLCTPDQAHQYLLVDHLIPDVVPALLL